MDNNFKFSLKEVLSYEGGWADHAHDPGGPTMRGITLTTFRRFIKPNATKADLKNITAIQISTIYRHQYWDAISACDLPSGVDFCTFDFAVNSGPKRAARFLQQIVGATADGIIGPETIEKCQLMKAEDIINQLCQKRLDFLQNLKTWKTFGKGWQNRINRVRESALKLAAAPQSQKAVLVVPKQLDKPLIKTSGFWERVTSLAGLAGIGGSSLLGDWKIILALTALLIVVSAFGLIFQDKIIKAINQLKNELG